MKNLFQEALLSYQPRLPKIFANTSAHNYENLDMGVNIDEEIKDIFKKTFSQNLVSFLPESLNKENPAINVGVILSGGQAPGGHNVISGLFDGLKSLNKDNKLLGFLLGPAGLINNNFRKIDADYLARFRNIGGFDIIGSGRTKLEGKEVFAKSLKVCNDNNIKAIVVIGGDDSNTNACLLAEYFVQQGSDIQVIGCPKTIDGDLKNEFIETSFGFDTACKVYSELIGNISKDILSSQKYWHFVRVMGRSASHIALECALSTRPNITLISEEVEAKQQTLSDIVNYILEIIESRSKNGKNYGLVIIPEGLIEFIPEMKRLINELNDLLSLNAQWTTDLFDDRLLLKSTLTEESQKLFKSLPIGIQKQLVMDRDPHGNVQVSLIETEKLIISLIQKKLKDKSINLTTQTHFFGYEGRCANPSIFDADYCYSLGYTTSALIANGKTGYISTVMNLEKGIENAQPGGVPLSSLMNIERRHGQNKPVIKKALVELNSAAFLYFKEQRDLWALEDKYNNPGPIQYFGPDEIIKQIPQLLKLEKNK